MAVLPNNSIRPKPGSRRLSREYQYAAEPLHRVATVRRQQGLSLRSAARQMGVDARELRVQEGETTNLRLTELYGWQRVLEVPIADLLVDPGAPLSRPVLERAQLLRLMKTVMAISEQSNSEVIGRLAETMINQLVEIMPELKDVGPWHSVGQRRGLDEYGRAAERCISEEYFYRHSSD